MALKIDVVVGVTRNGKQITRKYDLQDDEHVRELINRIPIVSELGLKELREQIEAAPPYIRKRYSITRLQEEIARPGHYDKRGIWREGETATPRTSAALSKVSDARHADKNNSRECHALIQSHVRLEMDYNDLRAETAELRHVLLSAAVLRPKLLIQYGAVPECVLDFCNRARAALEAAA